MLLALSIGAYALAMTIGRGNFGLLNAGLLGGAAAGLGLFILHATRTPSPLIRLGMFRDPSFTASVIMSALVLP